MSDTLSISQAPVCHWHHVRQMDEATLIRRAQHGDKIAFDDLIRRYDQAILRLAVRLTGSDHDGQDIYQEAFLKAYRNIARFRSESSFYTWMHRIVSNLCMDRLRGAKSRPRAETIYTDEEGKQHDELDYLADPSIESHPERQALGSELRTHIEASLGKLTPRERMVFELRHFEGLKLRVVGEVLNTSEETAKNTLFRATHKLRKFLAPLQRSRVTQLRCSESMALSR